MKTFTYDRAESPEAAVKSIDNAHARFIAGGTNLLDLMKLQVETPERLVDVSRLALTDIEDTESGGLRIGALVPNSDLAADKRVIARYEVLRTRKDLTESARIGRTGFISVLCCSGRSVDC